MPRIAFIINLGSKQASGETKQLLTKLFENKNFEVEILTCNDGKEIQSFSQQAIDNGAEILVAGGGDGTISTVAQIVMAHPALSLGILPLGTHNNFAKDLGIPMEIEKALDVILLGRTEMLNTGEVNGKIFINNSSFGLYPKIVTKREYREALGWGRLVAFATATLSAIKDFPQYRFTIKSGEESAEYISPMVFVGNGDYDLSTFGIAERRDPGRGQLAVIFFNKISRFGLIKIAVKDLFNLLDGDPHLKHFLLEEVEISTKTTSIPVACDGEIFTLNPPLRYRQNLNSLKIIKP